MIVLKGNHSGMQEELAAWCRKIQREGLLAEHCSEHTEVDSGHGRIETRHCTQFLLNPAWLSKAYRWSGLKSVIIIGSVVHEKLTGKEKI